MKAITTKYLGPTNTKPARIRASAEGVAPQTWSCEALYNQSRSLYCEAAARFAAHNNWNGSLASGSTAEPRVWVHCFIPEVVVETLKLANSLFDTVSCSERFDGLRDSVKTALARI